MENMRYEVAEKGCTSKALEAAAAQLVCYSKK